MVKYPPGPLQNLGLGLRLGLKLGIGLGSGLRVKDG